MSLLSLEGQNAETELNRLPGEEQREIVARALEANPSWIPSDDSSKTALWMTLIVGVLLVALSSIAAAVILVAIGEGELATAAWPIATAAVAGIVGLFAKSPTAS